MSRKQVSGLIGMIVGGGWLLMNLRHFSDQGWVAIGMPLIITVLGIIYFVSGRNEE